MISLKLTADYIGTGSTETENFNFQIGIASKFDIQDTTEKYTSLLDQAVQSTLNVSQDLDKTVFIYTGSTLSFNFYFYDNNIFDLSYTNQGYTYNDPNTYFFKKEKFKNSFFVIDYYNSKDSSNQLRLGRNYLNCFNGSSVLLNNLRYFFPTFLTNFNDTGYAIYITNDDILSISGNTIYGKTSFYNAESGTTVTFQRNADTASYNSPTQKYSEENEYFPITINRENRSFTITNPTNFYELVLIS